MIGDGTNHSIYCLNCGRRVEENFCPECGQKPVNRLSFGYFFELFMASVFQIRIGRSLFKTIWKLLIKPKEVALGYVKGKRARYYNPASMYMIFSGLYFFTRIPYVNEDGLDWSRYTDNDYYTLVVILVGLPMLAGMTFGLFRSYRLNYGEHLVLTAFYFSLYYVLHILFNLIWWATKIDTSTFNYFIAGFHLWVGLYFYLRIFPKRKWITIPGLIFILALISILPMFLATFLVDYNLI